MGYYHGGESVKDGKAVAYVREAETAESHGAKLMWPLESVIKIIDLPDPVTGQNLKIVVVEDDAQFVGKAMSFVDFDVLRVTCRFNHPAKSG